MNELIAREFEVRLRIHVEQVVREWWEVIILRDILDSQLGSSLVFKGGTALRLAYGSPRFSEDMDFSIIKPFDFSVFQKIARGIENRFSELEIRDLWSKYYTVVAEYRVKEPWLRRAFSVKIEISKRRQSDGFDSMLLSSEVSNVQVVGNVCTMDEILKEKMKALRTRKKARDVFDVWYIGQKLKKPVDISDCDIPLKQLTQELRKYLPVNYWKVIPALAKGKK